MTGTAAEWVWAIPLLPLVGFIINGILSVVAAGHPGPADPSAADASHGTGAGDADAPPPARHRYASLVSIVGPGVLFAAFALACVIFAAMLQVHPDAPFVQTYFHWIPVGDLQIDAAFQLDQLSMTMVLIITGVGALIHLFSVGYMGDDPGYPRYFAYLNLFVCFMLILVLGASYPVMFVGWEGVGLCSYLLIGFWFSDKANASAGLKAFVVNRIGDFGFLIAMFLLFANVGALDYLGVFKAAAGALPAGGAVITAICLFLFLGCAGKSAQIPLYVWLPDAMAGPTPVSALIHAATMVTAGVYLVARSGALFSLAPAASLTVAIVGAITAFFAATIGLKQWDIKKVLAYSTISQLGYMFMAVGAGAYVAGIFHLLTHAFFKALLFLGAGSVIHAMHAGYHAAHSHEDPQDMRNMGGLRQSLPVTWILMWIATLAIAGVPLFAGFFSKDDILATVFSRAGNSVLRDSQWFGISGATVLYAVYALGLAAALLTAIYMTRLMLYTFHGPNRTGAEAQKHMHDAPPVMTVPLIVLGVLSALGGFLNAPRFLPIGAVEGFAHWLDPVVGSATLRITNGVPVVPDSRVELTLSAIAVVVAVGGILIAIAVLKPAALVPAREAAPDPDHGVEGLLAHRYYVDEIYQRGIVSPIVDFSRRVLWQGVDALIDGLVTLAAVMWRWLGAIGSALQTGQVGIYAWAVVLGALLIMWVTVR